MVVQGTVKWFNNSKGYGFIGQRDGCSDVLVQYFRIVGNGHRMLDDATGSSSKWRQDPKCRKLQT